MTSGVQEKKIVLPIFWKLLPVVWNVGSLFAGSSLLFSDLSHFVCVCAVRNILD